MTANTGPLFAAIADALDDESMKELPPKAQVAIGAALALGEQIVTDINRIANSLEAIAYYKRIEHERRSTGATTFGPTGANAGG